MLVFRRNNNKVVKIDKEILRRLRLAKKRERERKEKNALSVVRYFHAIKLHQWEYSNKTHPINACFHNNSIEIL